MSGVERSSGGPGAPAGVRDVRHARFASVCVTGTNGKTTTSSMVAAVVAAAGEPVSLTTTMGATVDGQPILGDSSGRVFGAVVEASRAAGVRTLAIETTAQALDAGFARRWPPTVAVFTNLSRDHLDRFGTPAAYLAAKALLIESLLPGGWAVFNRDDPASGLLRALVPAGVHVRSFGHSAGTHAPDLPETLRIRSVHPTRDGTRVALAPGPLADRLGGCLELATLGAVNARNAAAAAVACDALGYGADAIRAGLAGFPGVRGRLEVVCQRPLVIVDYAHTADALEGLLAAGRALVEAQGARVVLVFGCGGDCDTGKRAPMGHVADLGADVVFLTSDNPRNEAPESIADDVERGRGAGGARWVRVIDRGRAIVRAISEAGVDDVVLIAGRGHERVQLFAGRKIVFCDAQAARAACAASSVA